MQRGQDQVPGEARLYGDLRGLEIADLADHDDVRILAQYRAQRAGEAQVDARADLRLTDAVEREFDRILDRHDIERASIESGHRGIERGRLARTGRAGDENDAVRLADQAIDRRQRRLTHSERGEVEPPRILVEQSQYDALAGSGRQGRHTHVDALVAELERHAPVLW